LFTGRGYAGTSTGLSLTPDTTTVTETENVTTTTYVNGSLVITETPTTTSETFVDGSISTGTHTRFTWDVPIPWRNSYPSFGGSAPSVVGAFYNDIMLLRSGSLPGLTPAGFGPTSQAPYTYIAVNLNPSKGAIGSVLWTKTWGPPPGNVTVAAGGVDPETRVFIELHKETRKFIGYSLETGDRLWTTESQGSLDYYGNPAVPYAASSIAYGKLYSGTLGGIIYCYDLPTGELLWTYGNGGPGNSTNSGFYLAYGHYPTYVAAIGDGVIYTMTAEHTVNTPIYKGALARAINATDGTELWTISDYDGSFFAISYAIADGFATFFNGYNNQIYSVGRGPSATTVSAPDVAAASGTPIVIKGTVTDISAGTEQNEQAARFPHGVPAVSDASMKDWMGYVYQQRPRPADAIGVDVTLNVIDSNNNYYEIGTATTNADGFFNLEWIPDIPGKYTVYATFEGTEGYWPSRAVTAFTVLEAPLPPPPEDPITLPPTETYITVATVAIIIAIAIVGLLLFRKR
jgi:hypothetical protein